jgi:hypothetical protein
MTWVVWRQQRALVSTVAVGLVLGVAAVLVLRAMMIADLNSAGIAGCVQDGPQPSGVCGGESTAGFMSVWFYRMQIGQILVLALPALVGVFIGAPLFAREFEQGTHALAFTQSVGRNRWLATKMLVTVPTALVVVVVMQFAVEYWLAAAGSLGPLMTGQFFFSTFGSVSVSPLAYALFACAVGMVAGVLLRRTLVAMTLTLGVFVVVRVAVNAFRGSLVPSTRVTSDGATAGADGWTVSNGYLDAKGEVFERAPRIDCGTQQVTACYHDRGVVHFRDIIPAGSVGALHLVEASIFLALSVLCVAGTVWAVRRQV